MAAKSVEIAVPLSPARAELTGAESSLPADPSQVIVIRPAAEIFIGGADVTSANGLGVPAGSTLQLSTSDEIYATTAEALGTTVRVLQIGIA